MPPSIPAQRTADKAACRVAGRGQRAGAHQLEAGSQRLARLARLLRHSCRAVGAQVALRLEHPPRNAIRAIGSEAPK
jgi:hypothetical protein